MDLAIQSPPSKLTLPLFLLLSRDTFARLSSVYLIARNLHKLLEVAMKDGPAAIPRSQARIVSQLNQPLKPRDREI